MLWFNTDQSLQGKYLPSAFDFPLICSIRTAIKDKHMSLIVTAHVSQRMQMRWYTGRSKAREDTGVLQYKFLCLSHMPFALLIQWQAIGSRN